MTFTRDFLGKIYHRNEQKNSKESVIGVGNPYYINTGYYVDCEHHTATFSSRLIELPFVYRNVRNPPAQVLDVGCAESILSISLAMQGYEVDGIDINGYGFAHKNFTFIKDNFLTHEFNKQYDIIVNLCAIEHFGLLAYGNTVEDMEADIKAVGKVYRLLKPKGQFLFTAPFGKHRIIPNFARYYDYADIKTLLKDFEIKKQKIDTDTILIEAEKR
jgi:SAM-dependent methyltransferase